MTSQSNRARKELKIKVAAPDREFPASANNQHESADADYLQDDHVSLQNHVG